MIAIALRYWREALFIAVVIPLAFGSTFGSKAKTELLAKDVK